MNKRFVMKSALVAMTAVVLAAVSGSGCKGYSWSSKVPHGLRTVSVPTFRNESNVQELGSVMARQTSREFQREGTFRVCSSDDAAIEVQGVVKYANAGAKAYNRRSGLRINSFAYSAKVEVSVVDRSNGRVMIDNRMYHATTTFASGEDRSTAMRDASGRLAEDLARQVVDDVLNLKW